MSLEKESKNQKEDSEISLENFSMPPELQKKIADLEKMKRQKFPDWVKPDVEKNIKKIQEEIDRERKRLLSHFESEVSPEAEEQMVNKILEEAGIEIDARTNRKTTKWYYGEGFSEFVDFTSKVGEGIGGGNQFNKTRHQFGMEFSARFRSDIDEFIDMRHMKKSAPSKVLVPAKKGFLGIGKREALYAPTEYVNKPFNEIVEGAKSQEPAVIFQYYIEGKEDYCVFQSGGSKWLRAVFILPESSAKELEQMVDENPKVMRVLVERAMKEKLLKDPSHWTMEDDRDVMRPPWEKWDDKPGGSRIYIQKEDSAPGFHEEYIHRTNKK